MRKYYFRVDGGSLYSVATGHIMRCLKLADYISKKENSQIYFIMKNYKEGISLVKNRYSVILLNPAQDINSEISKIKKIIQKGCCFICDIRGVDNRYIAEIKKKSSKFILFDDLGIKDISPDILINPTPFCYYGYKKNNYPDTILLLGEKFFFIDNYLIKRACIRAFKGKRYNIMASFGGADPCNITELFINNIAPCLEGHRISIILGPANIRQDVILEKHRHKKNIRFYTHLSSLSNIFLKNDIAFVCAGDTCIESCSSGVATFIVSSIAYEKNIGQLLHSKKMAYFVTDVEEIKNKILNNGYLDALNNRRFLRDISSNGFKLADGRGQRRIYDILLN
jgi:spore coat polysaccharide biosynthesis predicted glycosyltransferase SpsG